MQLIIDFLYQRFGGPCRPKPNKHRERRFQRKLGFEQLETRTMLNGAPIFTSTDDVAVAENTMDSFHWLTADDPDGDSVFYWISGGDDENQFMLDGSDGLVFSSSQDFESPGDIDGDNVYQVEVTPDDTMGNTTTQSISVTVTDVSEQPQFTSPNTASVEEGNANVMTLSAVDHEGNSVSLFSVSGSDGNLFTIDGGGNGTLETSPNMGEVTHSIDIYSGSFAVGTHNSRRTSGPWEQYYTMKPGKHYGFGGTFRFRQTGTNTFNSSLVRT